MVVGCPESGIPKGYKNRQLPIGRHVATYLTHSLKPSIPPFLFSQPTRQRNVARLHPRRGRCHELHRAGTGKFAQPDSSMRCACHSRLTGDITIDVYSKHALATVWAHAVPLILPAYAATRLSSPKFPAASSPRALNPTFNVRIQV